MNYRDYEYFEGTPDTWIEYNPLENYANLPWNEMKELDNEQLSDPNFEPILRSAFLDKVKDKKYSIVKNEVTGEYYYPLVPFRGNSAHSKKKYKRIDPIIKAFADKEFSRPVNGSRSTQVKLVQSIMITLTFTQEHSEEEFTKQGYPTKKWNAYDAWESITPLVNQFKMELSRVIGQEQISKDHGTDKEASYGSCLVKEGTESMYPAPHLIVVFDKPMVTHRYNRQWPLGPMGKDRKLVDKIQAIWERIAGSHCKINAIISAGGFAYTFKYIMKSIDIEDIDLNNMTHEQKVTFNTHMNQSLHRLNDIIPPSFLKKLDYTKELTLLDITRNKLKQIQKEMNRLEDKIELKGGYNPFTFSIYPHLNHYWDVVKIYYDLREEVHRIKMETSPWFYIGGGFYSVESAQNYLDYR